MTHPTLSRRDFGRRASGAAALASAAQSAFAQKPASANDRIRMGFIGVGEMGSGDPYEPCIATPDHWHAIPMIMACEAGKDVYVEKPVSHTLHEGRRMVEAARKTVRIVQVGTQQRSGAHFQEAVELVHSGKLGKVMRADTWINWNRTVEGLGNPPDTDPPHSLDWDLWLGPAPMRSYNRNRCIANFRWFWDYSTGMITDWGVHLIDVVHWAMGVDAPRTVSFAGGKWVQTDNTETPDIFEILYEYPQSPVSAKEFIVTFQSRFVNSHHDNGHSHGIEFVGTEGTLFLDRGGYTLYPEPDRSHGEAVAQSAVLGRKLNWDARQERFTGDEEANRHLTKEYRKPWNVA